MKVKELMEQLKKLDPEEDIFALDSEHGPEEVFGVEKILHYTISEHGRQLPKMIWCLV